jgi:HNH endonuclease
VRPQLLVTVDLDSLLGPGGVGGETGGPVPLDPEACRRLACDGAVTRVLVTRQPPGHDGDHGGDAGHHDLGGEGSLAAHLRVAATRLPAALGGAPTQPLEVGRATRVVSAAQRAALTVRDRGCAFPDCDRPPAWCDAHHLVHWLHGGPTDLPNLALLCRAHHRAVHEGGWRLGRDPDGHLTATPPHRRPRAAA